MTGPVDGPFQDFALEFTEDPAAFLEDVGPYLEADPVLNTVVTSVTARAAGDIAAGRARPAHPQWWVTVRDGAGAVVGVAMRTAPFRPHPLYVLPMPDPAARRLGEALVARGEAEAGANGALPASRIVTDVCAAAVGGTVEVVVHSRLWELGVLHEPVRPAGAARLAGPDDIDVCVAWFVAFHADADAQAGRAATREGMAEQFDHEEVGRRVTEGRVWLWVDASGQPVSLTGFNAPAYGVARVGPVYTPAARRGRGYASALVAHVSRTLRDAGARVCLFTDQANPTSNKIYAAVGFEPVVDAAQHAVVTAAGPGSVRP